MNIIEVMKHKKVTVRIIRNDEVNPEELQRNWNMFLDIVLRKSVSDKSPAVDIDCEADENGEDNDDDPF